MHGMGKRGRPIWGPCLVSLVCCLGDRLRCGKAGFLGCLVGFWVVEWGGLLIPGKGEKSCIIALVRPWEGGRHRREQSIQIC